LRAASIKINDDGSFNLLYGGTDLGTGSDTIIAQIAAETLGCKVEEIIVYAADTDITPFDTGAYASSTTFISGGAVKKAAVGVAKQIKEVAQRVPLERILIETDAPYLAPVPYRGKINQPSYVKHVAEEIATLRGISLNEVGQRTTENFERLFKKVNIQC
jgi:CO/xanthine dehydrogenase Mo-binding subunit